MVYSFEDYPLHNIIKLKLEAIDALKIKQSEHKIFE